MSNCSVRTEEQAKAAAHLDQVEAQAETRRREELANLQASFEARTSDLQGRIADLQGQVQAQAELLKALTEAKKEKGTAVPKKEKGKI